MLVIELSFLSGRFHATPWGRHVNEGIPEWPPSPYRLVRAIYDAWKRKRPDWSDTRVEPILSSLASSLPWFRLPPASVSHTRSFLSENTFNETDRKLVFDAFVVLPSTAKVLIGWPEVILSNQAEADLSELLSLINFFGRSESWVTAQLSPGNNLIEWNCYPADATPEGRQVETVRVACPVSMKAYAANPYQEPASSKKGDHKVITWLDALAWSTEKLLDSRLSEPPAFQYITYLRPIRCFDVEPLYRPAIREPLVNGVLYALESKILPQVTSTLEIAERVRTKLMGIHKRIVGSPDLISGKFSGKDKEGKPLIGHRHVYILPFDQDGDGRLDHLIVVCKESLDRSERIALDYLHSLWQPHGKPDIRCTPIRWGRVDDLFKPVSKVKSLTPFVPPRHYRRGRGDFGDWLIKEICRECNHHGLPQPIHVTPMQRLKVSHGHDFYWLEFRRNRKTDPAQIGYGFEMEFAQPVTGPIAIGYGSHLGLGQFVPVND